MTRSSEYYISPEEKLSQKRAAVVERTGDIPSLTVSEFYASLLPPIDPKHVNQLTSKLRADGSFKNAFESLPSKANKCHEDTYFRPLELVFNNIATWYHDILKADGISTPSTLNRMISNPNQTPIGKSVHRVRPDAYIVKVSEETIIPEGSSPLWADVAVVFEYKVQSTFNNEADNRAKVIWAMTHLMANNPCRRFVYGVTIEGGNMRMWYCDRSGFSSSEIIRWNEDPREMIEAFAAFGLSSIMELGFDPTIRPVKPTDDQMQTTDDEEQFDIDVFSWPKGQKRTFRTIGILSNHVAEYVVGRATRVWEVKEVFDDGTLSDCTYALKDS